MPEPRLLTGPEAIAEGVRSLRTGHLVAFPTETVYGLGADARSPDAVAAVFRLKGRPSNNPLIVHVSGAEMARTVTASWPTIAQKLADAFWPGPLTLVLPKSDAIPPSVTASGRTVAVRCPDHPVALALIEAFGGPIVGPSANPSGMLSPTTAEHVIAGFPHDDLPVIDGGACRAGIESTVIDLTATPPRILRPGIIGASAIARVLGGPVDRLQPHGDPGSIPAAPGLLGPHYQPSTPVRIVESPEGALPTDALVVWSTDHHPAGGPVFRIPPNPEGYAAALYALLHTADRTGSARILVEIPPQPVDTDGQAVRDAILERLARAAAAPTAQSGQ
ncbi:MAG: threonylcarbamoyl-AMP synthase [Planctomycetota bacterium]|nr:MAG: threonylcarbamoyl-AMP synthase [Planctomycetota bacterium]